MEELELDQLSACRANLLPSKPLPNLPQWVTRIFTTSDFVSCIALRLNRAK